MPIQFPDFQRTSFEDASPYNRALAQAFNVFGKGVQSAYAPRMTNADIFSKQFGPLAQIASNPLAMAMMGDKGKGIMDMISQLLAQNAGNSGMAGSGSPNMMGGSGGGNSLRFNEGQARGVPGSTGGYPGQSSGYEYDENGRNVVGTPSPSQIEGSPQVTEQTPQSISNLPTGKTLPEKLVQHATAQSNQQLYPPGTTYIDENGKLITTSTSTTLQQDQVAQGAAQSVLPLLEKLSDEGDDLLKNGRNFKLLSSTFAAGLGTMGIGEEKIPAFLKKHGVTKEYYNKWQQFQKDQNDAAAKLGLVYSYGNNLAGEATARSQVAPSPLEDDKSYHSRIATEIQKVKYQNELAKRHNTGGFQQTPGGGVETPANPFKQPPGKNEGFTPDIFLQYKFKDAKEFNDALKVYSPEFRQKVRDLMQKKGWTKKAVTE